MNLIIAGKDVVATDATGCRVMGIDPHKIKHIMRANEKGIGNIDNINIIGEKLESVTRPIQTRQNPISCPTTTGLPCPFITF